MVPCCPLLCRVFAPLSLQAYMSRMHKLAANKLLSSPSLEQLARWGAAVELWSSSAK
jgi:hypothetical protein